MDTEDGQAFIKNLAYFVRTHEKALANALQLQRQNSKQNNGASSPTISGSSPSASSTTISSSSTFAAALSLPYLSFTSQNIKPQKLTLTPHHLFYLLSRFEELAVQVGPMNVRLENIHSDTAVTNYVSFLSSAQRNKSRNSDRDSIHSISSIRSVMSGMTSLWSSFGLSSNSTTKTEKQKAAIKEDLRYLYSAFTKIPCLRLAPDHKARLIAGYEEFPFDTAVPLFVFKNLSALEIYDVDFRQFFGWDVLAEGLRSLTVKRAGVDDPADILINVVLDDMDKRRRRSAKGQASPVIPWPAASPTPKQVELARSESYPDSPTIADRRGSVGSPHASQLRRSSGSSGSSVKSNTPRGSSSNLLSLGLVPSTKWRFLRHLSLADNGLTSISASSLSPLVNTLHSLDLSSNHFAEIPDSLATLVSLRALNLSNCMIESLHSLGRNPLPAITTLNLRSNRLISIAGIQRLFSLERLDLRDNKIADPSEIARLTGIPEISEIFVTKNPFVKTHPNYRVTIFNLFRSTPGHANDIIIDTTGPAYAERKQLVDRVPEPVNVPVMRPPPEDDVSNPPEPITAVTRALQADHLSTVNQDASHYRRGIDPGGLSQRRKKGPKRRIVELSQAETPPPTYLVPQLPPIQPHPAISDDSTYGGSPDATPTRKQSFPTQDRPSIVPDGPATTSGVPNREVDETSAPNASTASPQDVNVNSDTYRKKIQALRSDLGNGWLSALGDETWEEPRDSNRADDANPAQSIVPPANSTRASSQGIISVGRSLG
ncbi:hypothetical protein M501DRAFT_936628 [Patellaria atrata CBS 101060]|uniref:Leucine-rich repeat-containing protein n=1 Tax=Patellaria atrata CBS 101060 TaxID=1346257 RepID=A0A9P4S843_9PEZI|nr:hypothetical protein M501DRAFT_936628 [Patellaria atrata CBS 101060]